MDSATAVGFAGTDEVRWYWADARFIGGEFFVRAGKSNVPGVDVFLQWSDPEPLPVSHVAVSSWDSEGEWRVCSDRVFGTPHSRQVCGRNTGQAPACQGRELPPGRCR